MTQHFPPAQIAAMFILAVTVGSVPSLQPLLLGSLLAEGRLTPAALGYVGTIEGLGLLAGTTVAALLFAPNRLRPISAAALVVVAVANLVTMVGDLAAILLARGMSGFASGVVLWILVGMLTRAAAPARLFAIYVTSQATTSFLLSVLFSTLIIPRIGAAGGYAALACANVALLAPALLLIPRRYTPIAGAVLKLPTARGSVGLLAVACYLAGVTALWVYLVPFGEALGHSETVIHRIISTAIAVQIAAGLAATWASAHLSGARTNAICALLAALAVGTILFGGSHLALFVLAACAFNFLWMFAPAFHLPLLIDLDPSRRTAGFVSVAQLGGLSIGPLASSLAVGSGNYRAAAVASILFFVSSSILSRRAVRTSRRPLAAAER